MSSKTKQVELYLNDLIQCIDDDFLEVSSDELCDEFSRFNSPEMCNIMRKVMKPGDEVIASVFTNHIPSITVR